PLTGSRPIVEMLQLHAQDRALNPIQPAVSSSKLMLVPCQAAIVGDLARPNCELLVIRAKTSCVTVRAKVFSWIKTEARDVAHRADFFSFVSRAMGLGAIFHYLEIMFASDSHDLIHFGRQPIKMHRDDGFGFARDLRFELRRIHRVEV